jgi:hypothetical protein
MKKRFVIPAALFGGLCSLGTLGAILIHFDIKSCNSGDVKACESIAKTHGTDFSFKDEIKHRSYWKAMAKQTKLENDARIAKEKREAEANRFKPDRYNVMMLASSCAEKHIKPMLKDPYSFREIQHGYNMGATTIDVTVEYTATNGFGGRVRNNHTCTYTL